MLLNSNKSYPAMSIRRFIFLNEKLFMKIKKHILFTFFKPMDKILYRRNKRQSFF